MDLCIAVKCDDLVAKNTVLVGFNNACDYVLAVCLEVCDEGCDVAIAVDKEETVDVGELCKTCCVDDLTKVKFALSLSGKC